ncbi:Long-chain base-1-phosphate phosphatase [Teratosphaeriaceae sp. CCFEE 6253]|nr:Long-chain base-1-phosphate phosphatase [Teratosphaeriaceae sp. CCFEE 6253]
MAASNSKPHERLAAHLSRPPTPNSDPDAGLRGLGHYERRLPDWRFRLRQRLIPIVRWETPYLARMQQAWRSPWLDTYFALTANLGTHTFFMTALPICYWCGFPDMGNALVHMLAMGVYFSGFVKDLACLPRPLSPPLQRITMSGSAALEYGFPSTHTTNAVSVAVFCLSQIYASRDGYAPWMYHSLQAVFYCYAASISLGRMYCGMHGFFDVIIGGLLGAAIAWVRIAYGAAFDAWMIAGDWTRPAIAVLILAIAVRIHSEPADNCPCFDDSVAFAGVVMGIEIGGWHYAQQPANPAGDRLVRYHFDNDPFKVGARIVGGIMVIFVWRAVMKTTLLRYLPPIYRAVDHWGVRLPRRYFLQSRDYKSVPPLRSDDNVIPQASEISALMSSLRHPRRRTISIGPQSEADAREFMANRAQRRRNSRGSEPERSERRRARRHASPPTPAIDDSTSSPESASYMSAGRTARNSRQQQQQSFLQVSAVDINLLTPPASDAGMSSDSGREDDRRDREMFSALEKPRIRYDVEVITKIVVYAGIAWWAVEGNPLLFRWAGVA